jgi:hypothetical protein
VLVLPRAIFAVLLRSECVGMRLFALLPKAKEDLAQGVCIFLFVCVCVVVRGVGGGGRYELMFLFLKNYSSRTYYSSTCRICAIVINLSHPYATRRLRVYCGKRGYVGLHMVQRQHAWCDASQLQPAPPLLHLAPPLLHPAPPLLQPAPPLLQPAPPLLQPAPPLLQPAPPLLQPAPPLLSWG